MSSPTNHALLSASSAHRWLSAPPLPCLERFFPHPTSSAAAEGTAAHALGEYKVHRALGHQFTRPVSDYQSDEMETYTDDYCSNDFNAFAIFEIDNVQQVVTDNYAVASPEAFWHIV